MDVLLQPWPWYVSGPLLGLIVPLLLLFGGKSFGISSSYRHVDAALLPRRRRPAFFDYDWRKEGAWNLCFVGGLVGGGVLAAVLLGGEEQRVLELAPAAQEAFAALGIEDRRGLAPDDWIAWEALGSLPGAFVLVVGGFSLGFGARWAGGCTSGHGISGLANRQLPSLVAVIGFFVGGLAATHLLMPLLAGGGAG